MSGPEYALRLAEVERELWALQEAIERLATEYESRRNGTWTLAARDLRIIIDHARDAGGGR